MRPNNRGIDSKTKELTDFGGGVSYKKDANVIVGALREYNEETLSVYPLSINDVQDSVALYDECCLVIFKKVDHVKDIQQQLSPIPDARKPGERHVVWRGSRLRSGGGIRRSCRRAGRDTIG